MFASAGACGKIWDIEAERRCCARRIRCLLASSTSLAVGKGKGKRRLTCGAAADETSAGGWTAPAVAATAGGTASAVAATAGGTASAVAATARGTASAVAATAGGTASAVAETAGGTASAVAATAGGTASAATAGGICGWLSTGTPAIVSATCAATVMI